MVLAGGRAEGVCIAQRRNGEGCASDYECVSGYCAEQTVCRNPKSTDAASSWCVGESGLSSR